MPSPPYCGLDLVPSLADLFIRGLPQSIIAFPHTSPQTLRSSHHSGHPVLQRDIPLAGEALPPPLESSAPHPSAEGTLTLLDSMRCPAHNTKLSEIERTFLDPMREFNAGDGDRGAPKALQSKHWTQKKV